MKEDFRAGVGLSRKWDAREAGREVAETALEKLDGEKPKFFLLFSTIHYEKYGGFQELLNGVWEVLPEGIPLIGGTVAGFMNNYGCYTRGATALAVSYPRMDVAVGVGHNTKRDPQKAARESAKMIEEELKTSNYTNKFLFNLTASGIVPSLPGMGRKRVITTGFGDVLLKTLNTTCKRLQIGPGREDEIIETLAKELKDFSILGGSTVDDNRWEKNFQFLNQEVIENSVVNLGFKTDLHWEINTTFGLKPTGIKMMPTKVTLFDCAIKQFENEPAVQYFLKRMGWHEDLFDENIHRRTLFYPLCYTKEGLLVPRVIALIIKNTMVFTNKVPKDQHMEIYNASGESLVNSVKENLSIYKSDGLGFGMIVSCTARLETLGKASYEVQNILKEFYRDVPFILIYASGEHVYKPGSTPVRLNESFNIANFYAL